MQALAAHRHRLPGPVKPAMISLPVCRWRGDYAQQRYVCNSDKFLDAPNRVGAEFCARCRCVDHAPSPPPPRVLPCVHLGGVTGPAVENHSTSSKERFSLFGCTLHGHCTPTWTEADVPADVPRCARCPDYLPRDPFGPNSAQMLQTAEAFLAEIPDYPEGRYRGRGVIIAGGGERYFPSLYVSVRALRHAGCGLPIQVWYLGRNDEMPAERQALLAPYGVECVDADAVRVRHPARTLNGWELKVFATLHSDFEELLFLDADCYPCRNPEFLFDHADYRARGAVFWPDVALIDDRLRWPAFGVADPRRLGSVESGQYVLNKRLVWKALNLAWFYNDYSDYYYRYCYGDKHTFEVAWARCGPPFVMWEPNARWVGVAYLHPGPDGLPLFVHRCADKFRFDPQAYMTHQHHPTPAFQPDLPLERECWGWLAELGRLVGRTPDLAAVSGEGEPGA